MQQRVLITGGSGLLALNWAQSVRSHCAITLGLHNREISLAGTRTKNIDIESVDQLVRAFEEIDCQVVVHTAGLTNVEQCESDPSVAYYVNVTLALNVAKACAKLGIQLVHISSDHLFSGKEPLVTEEQPTNPINVYGKSKAEAECRVRESNPQALVIRTNFFGWGTGYRHSFSDIVIETLRSGKELTLFQDVFYTPILAETAVLAIHELIDRKANGIFNVIGDERVSKYEFGISLADKFDLDRSLIKQGFIADQGNLVQRPLDMSLSNQKVTDILDRNLGGVIEHIARLHQQERISLAEELKIL
jgi:dTDP-4-dehydrorhamnose reductase